MSETGVQKKNVANTVGNIIAAFFCIIAALLLWYSVSDKDATTITKTFENMNIEMTNNSSFSILSGDDFTIDVTISGKRAIINKLSREEVTIYAVIPEDATAGSTVCSIQCETPNGTECVGLSSKSMTIRIGNTKAVTVPVMVSISGYSITEPYYLDESKITLDVSEITVTGAADIVDNIIKAELEAKAGSLTGTAKINGSVRFIDADGNEIVSKYIKADHNNVTATIPVMMKRDIDVNVSFLSGIFNESNCMVEITPKTISVDGIADTVKKQSFDYTIDEKTIEDGETIRTFDISLPNDVKTSDEYDKITVKIIANGISSKTFTVSGSDIKLTNPDGLNCELPESLFVTVRGDSKSLAKFGIYDLTISADITGKTAGIQDIPVSVTVSPSFSKQIYVVGEYKAHIRITE